MANEGLRLLLRGLCESTGIADVETVLETGCVEVGGVAFSIHSEDDEQGPAADTLMVYCDFGPPPEKNQLAVLRRLLEVNIYLADGPCTASYSINPDTGHVVLACQLKISALTSYDLREILESCAREAQQWGQSHYLDALPASASGTAYNALVKTRPRP